MNEVAERVAALDEMLQERTKALQKRIKITIGVYVALALIVVWYTSVVLSTMKELTSRKAVAEHVQSYLREQITPKREELVAQLRENSDELAEQCVGSIVKQVVPQVEEIARFILDELADSVAVAIEKQMMPAFVDFIKQDSDKLKAQYADLQDDEVAKGVVGIFVSVIEEELDKVLDRDFEEKAQELQQRLVLLSRAKKGELTKQQDAQRRALMYWSYLAQHHDPGTSIYYDMLMDVKDRFGVYFGKDAGEDDVVSDEEGQVLEQ